ncbi:MAG: signal peptidase I [Quadrisphaera sp.]
MSALPSRMRVLGLLVLFVGLALTAWAQLSGLRAVPVLSGSMTPYAAQGALVVTEPVAPQAVRTGDVVAFVPPAPFARGDHPVMHRVAALEQVDGKTVMTTRGDANPQPDPWRIALSGADLGRAVLVVPWAGWAVMAGPAPVVLVLLGLFAAGEGLSLLRRPACTCVPADVTAVPAAAPELLCAPELVDEPGLPVAAAAGGAADVVVVSVVVVGDPVALAEPAPRGPTSAAAPTVPWLPAPRHPLEQESRPTSRT